MTARWWQWGCRTARPGLPGPSERPAGRGGRPRRGAQPGCGPGRPGGQRAGSQAGGRAARRERRPGSSARAPPRVCRRRPTAPGPSTSRRSQRLARSSMPKSYSVRPQQAQPTGTATVSPRASNAPTMSLRRARVERVGESVGPHDHGGRPRAPGPVRPGTLPERSPCSSPCRGEARRRAARGDAGEAFQARRRDRGAPGRRWPAVPSPADAVAARAAQGSRPMAYMAAGRRRPL